MATAISSAATTRTADTLAGTDNVPLGNGTGSCKIAASELLEGLATVTADAAGVRTALAVAGTAGTLAQFAATTSAQLAGVINDETGSGALVFATSPTLVTPALGTPASGILTNCTFPTLNQNTTGTAAVATTVTAANEASDTTCFPLFVTAATGNLGVKTNAGLGFNSSTGLVTAESLTTTGLVRLTPTTITNGFGTATVAQTAYFDDDGPESTFRFNYGAARKNALGEATCVIYGDLTNGIQIGTCGGSNTARIDLTASGSRIDLSAPTVAVDGNAFTVTILGATWTWPDTDAAGVLVSDGLGTLSFSTGYATTAAVAAGYQPLDADLTAAAGLGTTGIVRRTGAGTWTAGTAVGLTTEVTGTLPVANGGTGLTALGTALQVLRVNAGGTANEYATLAGGGNAQTADPLSQFAATTSAQLRSVISDETGTGVLYFQGGDAGTPSALVGTNITGTATGLTAGVATTVTVADEAADTTCFVGFVTAATGNLGVKSNSGLTFNSSTGVLTATGFAGPLTGAVTGNASTATALQTARAINGTNFDGTAAITVTAAAGTLTGTTLNATVVTSSLTSVGTITSGVWTGTAVAVANGGTGASTALGARTNIGFVTHTTLGTTGAVSIDTSTSTSFILSLTGNVTLSVTNDADGHRFTLYVRGQASGFTITWFGSIKWSGGAAPTIPTVSGRVMPIGFVRLATGEWLGIPGSECY